LSDTETAENREHTVRLIGVLGSAAGQREMRIEVPPTSTLSDLISTLVKKVDKHQFKELLIDAGTNSPQPNVILLLNDQDCNLFQGLRTELEPGTHVTIIPVAHGG
jgi:molybdopterin converting factor small subunit